MKQYNISITVEDSNKYFYFHTDSQDLRPEQVLALLDALNKSVKSELMEPIERDKCEYYISGKCKGSKNFMLVDCRGIKDNCFL